MTEQEIVLEPLSAMETPFLGLDHVQVAAPPGCEVVARRFYGELLGLVEIEKPPLLAARGGCWFQLGAHELHIGVAADFVPATKAHPGISVSSSPALGDLARRLEAAGAAVEWADPAEIAGRERFHVHDPWGNRLEFIADT
jgi:catechol 2,3-dioxygenase-like lactoylglutathione lyase family enzyme